MLACTHTAHRQFCTILQYKDFGPPALATDLIGTSWWQWDNHGDSHPREYPISVIVYRDVDLEMLETLFPVSETKKQDYRYVAYSKAMDFLNNAIEELSHQKDAIPIKMMNTLINTRNKIQFELVKAEENN